MSVITFRRAVLNSSRGGRRQSSSSACRRPWLARTGIAIELDGAQHLADADAYRRDRRKDALLQQHGYLVLRFLAEDAGKQLDHVLDAVLAALANRHSERK
jgi:very-short-patch-repair endonuclease